MSDYLSNLVSRSFSSLAPVQPGTASLAAAPELFENSLEKFSDPFAEAEDIALIEDRDQSNRLEDKPGNPETSRGDSQRSDQRRKPGTIAPKTIDVSLPSSVRPTYLTPLQETSGVPDANSGALQGKAFQGEELQETPPWSSGITPLIKSVPEGDIHRSPLGIQKKPGQLSPQTFAALLTPGSAAGDRSQRPGPSGSVAASDDRQVRSTPSTIIPKVQPPLPITVNRGTNTASGRVPSETAAQPPFTETIVNVAIGRIEVSATSMESPKREQQAKGPKVMNLDDYMQQRSRGNR